jgi:uncharacterized protein YhdP
LNLTHEILALIFNTFVLLIAIIGLVLYWLPAIDDYKWLIEREVSAYVGNQVKVDKIRVNHGEGAPTWSLEGVHLIEANGDSPIHIKKLTLGFDWQESLRTLQAQPSVVEVDGVELVLRQGKDIPDLKGLEFPLPGQQTSVINTTRQTPIRVQVKNGVLHWQGAKGQELTLENTHFTGEFSDNTVLLQAQTDFPAEIGKQLIIDANLRKQADEWQGQIHAAATIQHVEALPHPRLAQLGFKQGGLIFDAHIRLEPQQTPQFNAEGRLSNAVFSGTKSLPAIAPLDLDFKASNDAGEVKAFIQQGAINYPQWFEKPIQVDKLQALLNWQRIPQGWQINLSDLQLSNRDARAQGRGHYLIKDQQKPYIDLAMQFATNRTVDNVRQYIPSIIIDGTEAWLKTAIVQGYVPRGEFILKGDPSDFPFTHKPGVFDIRFDVENGILAYQADWPLAKQVKGELRFHNAGMSGKVASAKIMDLDVTAGTVDIPDMLGESHLLLDLHTKGSLKGHLDYLQAAPIGKHLRDFMQIAQFKGDSILNIKIDVPLDKPVFIKKGVSVLGKLTLDNDSFSLPEYNQSFSDLSGIVNFDQVGVSAQNVWANYRGQAIQINANTDKQGKKIQIALMQQNTVSAYLPAALHFLAPYFSGQTGVKVYINLPSFNTNETKQTANLAINAETNLQGVAIDLPPPLAKAPNTNQAFTLKLLIPFASFKAWQLQANLNQWLSVNALIPRQNNQRAAISVGLNEQVALPNEGLLIRGQLAEVNLLNLLKFNFASESPQKTAFDLPVWLDIAIQHLQLANQDLGQAQLIVNSDKNLQASLINNSIKATITGLSQARSLDLVRLDLQGINFNKLLAQVKKPTQNLNTTLHAASIPALQIDCHDCQYADLKFKQLLLETTKQHKQINLKRLIALTDNWQFSSKQGSWQTGKQALTRLTGNLQVNELASIMDKPASLQGALQAQLNLQWLANPWEFALDKLTGNAHIRVANGKLTASSLNKVRWLGLLDWSRLPTNLKTGFADYKSQGLPFEEIQADLAIQASKVRTQNLYIKTAALLVSLQGELDLVKQMLDAKLAILPDWRLALPLLGGALGGVGGGGLGLAASQLAKPNLQAKLHSPVRLNLQLSGTLSKPTLRLFPLNSQTANSDFCSDLDAQLYAPQCMPALNSLPPR